MILYHGSRQIVEYPGIRKEKFNKDFYFGFYCTRCKEQAKRSALRYGENSYVNKYAYIPNDKLNCLIFNGMTEEWLDFIVACRNGQSHPYDIVEGPMMDDKIYNYTQNFIDEKNFKDSVLGTCQVRESCVSNQFPHGKSAGYIKLYWK